MTVWWPEGETHGFRVGDFVTFPASEVFPGIEIDDSPTPTRAFRVEAVWPTPEFSNARNRHERRAAMAKARE